MKFKAKKGCINSECTMCKKKKHAHKNDLYCSQCGGELVFVCEKCHTVLDDGSEKLCIICQAKKDDTKEKRKDAFGKLGAGVAAVATTVPAIVVAVVKKQ